MDPICPNSGGTPDKIVSHSRYNEPLATEGLRGRSRRWGDASPDVQQKVIDIITAEAALQGVSSELPFLLAVARLESGFNPDAAAGTSSAAGVGQLIRDTARSLRVQDAFDAKESVKGMVTLLKTHLSQATRSGLQGIERFTRAYALYHDGPSLAYGGEKIANEKLRPWIERFFRQNEIGCRP